jgi:hypothetical protein
MTYDQRQHDQPKERDSDRRTNEHRLRRRQAPIPSGIGAG